MDFFARNNFFSIFEKKTKSKFLTKKKCCQPVPAHPSRPDGQFWTVFGQNDGHNGVHKGKMWIFVAQIFFFDFEKKKFKFLFKIFLTKNIAVALNKPIGIRQSPILDSFWTKWQKR